MEKVVASIFTDSLTAPRPTVIGFINRAAYEIETGKTYKWLESTYQLPFRHIRSFSPIVTGFV